MKVLYLDCFSGISGDMTVGALCDLGVKPSALEWELSKLEIGDFHMHFDRAQRQKIEGIHFSIHEGATHKADHDHDHDRGHEHAHCHGHCHSHDHDHSHEHGHAHEEEHEHGVSAHAHHEPHGHAASVAQSPQANDQDHGSEVPGAKARHEEEHAHSHAHHHEHAHGHHHHHHEHVHGRTHREIRDLIEKSDLSAFVKKHALGIFQRIAEAEGKIHGMSAEDVHFHEVGALDSIADVVCICVGLESLGVEKVYVSALHEGRGWIDCAHGRFPLPAPATLEILKGIPIGETDETHELITPTGAGIVAEFAVASGPMPRMKVEKIGYGIGSRDLASRPNVLRAVLGELAPE